MDEQAESLTSHWVVPPTSSSASGKTDAELLVELFDRDPDFRRSIQHAFGRHLSERLWVQVPDADKLAVFAAHYGASGPDAGAAIRSVHAAVTGTKPAAPPAAGRADAVKLLKRAP